MAVAAFLNWSEYGREAIEDGPFRSDAEEQVRGGDEETPILAGGQSEAIYDNGYFQLQYNEEREQPDWVRYTLKKDNLRKKRHPRPRNFYPDGSIKTGSAVDDDYRGSGYSRGHLVPNADMSWNKEAQRNTFLFSNISPQTTGCNGGIWRELEENTRDWAFKFVAIKIASGPIWEGNEKEIGRNKVDVPKYYFKAIMDDRDPEKKAIGFIIPNDVSYKHLNKYAVSIDEIEQRTGIDLFSEVSDPLEQKLESSFDLSLWPIDNKRFELRKNQWNRR